MTDDLTITFTADCAPAQAFAAITDVRAWWSGDIDGPTDTLGAEFTYRYQDVHRSTQRITELDPGRRVAWHVLDSYLGFVDDTAEWTGTDITFDITPVADGTEVRFRHVGLGRDVACFESCSSAWNFYITGSLRDLISSGLGQPNPTAADPPVTA
jgi:hypothetical protein